MRYDTSSRKGRWLQVFLRQYGVSKFTICNHGTYGCLIRFFRPDLLAAALRATGQPDTVRPGRCRYWLNDYWHETTAMAVLQALPAISPEPVPTRSATIRDVENMCVYLIRNDAPPRYPLSKYPSSRVEDIFKHPYYYEKRDELLYTAAENWGKKRRRRLKLRMMRRVLNRLRHDPRFFEHLQRDANFFTSTLDFRVAVWMTFERACRALPHLKSDYLDQLLKDTWVGSLRDNGWTQCADVGLGREMEGLRRRGQVA